MGWVYATCYGCGEGRAKVSLHKLAHGLLECRCGEPFDVPESEKWSAVEDAIEELGQQIIGGLIQ